MNLTRLAIRNAQFVVIVILIAIVLSVRSFISMSRSEDPQVNFPFYNMVIVYPGTSPEDMENLMKEKCANCQKRADVDVEFKRCSRCKSIWYCSKECQVKHWSACHKSDCMLSGHV